MSPSKPLSGPMELQILRTLHPPAPLLEQIALLHTEAGFPITSTEVRKRIDNLPKSDRLLLAVSGEHLIGYAHLRVTCDLFHDRTAEIVSILVREPYRKQYIGRRLLKAAETWARQSGLSRVVLFVDHNKEDVIQFSLAMDYQEDRNLLELFRDLDPGS
jgi:ribosomal protein S18 acetylase RimI-like enzyme